MKVNDLLSALNQLKAKAPQYDFGNFELMIDDKNPQQIGLDVDSFKINLSTTPVEQPEEVVEEVVEED